jgi:hypothetical protein
MIEWKFSVRAKKYKNIIVQIELLNLDEKLQNEL